MKKPRELGMLSLEKRRLKKNLAMCINSSKVGRELGRWIQASSQWYPVTGQEAKKHKLKYRKVQFNITKMSLLCR